jgi:hypothetical protein
LVIRTVTSGSGINLSSSSALTVGGNLTVTTNNGAISQTGVLTVGSISSEGGVGSSLASFTTGNNTVTLSNAGNDFQNVAFSTGNTTTATGNVSVADKNILRLGASSIGGDLTASVVGNSTIENTALATTGTLTIAGNASFTQTGGFASATNNQSAINIGNNSTIGGTLSGSVAGNSSFTFNGLGNLTTGTITSNNSSSGGNRTGVTITTTGNLTVTGTITTLSNNTTANGSISLTGASINHTGGTLMAGNASKAGGVTMNATAGNLTVGNIDSYNRVDLRATGSVSQTAGTTITTRNTSTDVAHVLRAGTNVTLTNTNALAAGTTTQITAGGTASLTNAGAIILGTTNVTGNVSLTTTNSQITIGDGEGSAAQRITIGGALNATAGTAAIVDNDYSPVDIFGGVNLTAASVTLNAANALGGLSPRITLGQVNVTATGGAVDVRESTTLNLGNITASTLRAESTTGGVVDSGTLSLTTNATFVAPSTQTIVIDGTSNSIPTLNVSGGNDNAVTLNSATTLGSGTSVSGNLTLTTTTGNGVSIAGPTVTGNLTVNSGSTIAVTAGTSITGNITLNAADAGTTATSGIYDTGSLSAAGGYLNVSGVTTLNSAGIITLDGPNDFSSVVLNNSTGNVTVNDINNLTVSGAASGTLTATAGAITSAGASQSSIGNPWNLVLGNLHVASLIAKAAAGSADSGNSGTITQASGTNIHSFGTANFTTTNSNIIIGNNGNSFGRVGLFVTDTDGSRTVTLVEDGTIKLGNLSSRGGSTITSRFGSIIEDPDSSNTITNNGTLTLNAVNGSVLIGNTTNVTGTTGGNLTAVVANAPNGAVAVQSSNKLALGNITANSLTVNVTGGDGNITQSGVLKIYGTSTFVATRNITLTNNSNNFGRLFLTTANVERDIQVNEAGTLNLGGVTMPASTAGNITLTSVNGDIIDSGLGGVKLGGSVSAIGTGVVTLGAANGNIVLDDPTTDFATSGGVVFNGKNVTLSPLGGTTAAPLTLVLGANNSTSVAGNLTVTSAIGHIGNGGNLSITNDAFFQTGNGNITLTQAGNRFGTVRFTGNVVRITQANDINIVTGSSAIGAAEFTSGSYITIANRGGIVTLGSTGNFTAAGTIDLPKLIQAAGTLTVNSPSTKDLSKLSQTSDLAGKSPINLGTGTYLPPQP